MPSLQTTFLLLYNQHQHRNGYEPFFLTSCIFGFPGFGMGLLSKALNPEWQMLSLSTQRGSLKQNEVASRFLSHITHLLSRAEEMARWGKATAVLAWGPQFGSSAFMCVASYTPMVPSLWWTETRYCWELVRQLVSQKTWAPDAKRPLIDRVQ